MHKRNLLLALIAALVALAAVSLTVATGRTPRRVTATATYRVQDFSQTKGYPAVGTRAVYTGTVTSRLGRRGRLRRGAVIVRNKITSVHGNVVTSAVSFTSYYPDGINKHRGSTTATLQPDGSIDLKGKGKITGGTGRWRRLRGAFISTGSQDCFGCRLTFKGRAKLRY